MLDKKPSSQVARGNKSYAVRRLRERTQVPLSDFFYGILATYMGVSQTKKNLQWSVFVFAFIFLFSTALYVVADEAATMTTVAFDDSDGDGLSDEEEKIYGTDPTVADTDGDSYSDGVEIKGGFDPLKPAPGDRVTPEEVNTDIGTTGEAAENLTEKATQGLVNLVNEKSESDGAKEITQEDLDTVIADVMTPNEEDIVLPEVDMSQIKIKEVPETLSGEDAVEQHRQDAVEYLTLVSYIFISNSPAQIRDMSGLKSFLLDSSNKVILGMLSGNYTFMDSLEEMGKKSLDEVEKIEVPESMLDTHVKTIKLLTFASTLKASIKASLSPNDPIGQMYTLSKVQGFLMTFDSYTQETQGILTAIGVKNIPLDI